jgi:hypothetical protein
MKIETFKMTEAELIRALGNAELAYRNISQARNDFPSLLESQRILVEIQLYRLELEKRTLSACV